MATSKQCMYVCMHACMYVYMFFMYVHACVLCGMFYLLSQDGLPETVYQNIHAHILLFV